MTQILTKILNEERLNKDDIVFLLNLNDSQELEMLYEKARQLRNYYCGNKVFFRGLIEVSNICRKNCLYCGIRSGNNMIIHYDISGNEIIDIAKMAWDNGLKALVLQSGETTSKSFTDKITACLKAISEYTNSGMRITLSLGEQKKEIYQEWKEAGADAYLLRIETSNPELFRIIHPNNHIHRFEDRIKAIHNLKDTGFQLGTGIMIGLPFQTIEDLADDLLFIQKTDVDMVGMGPYLEHEQTPLFKYKKLLLPKTERMQLTLKMYAVLRILMKDINIASTTALEAISTNGRSLGINAGANVIMPNITSERYLGNYLIYQNKPINKESFDEIIKKTIAEIELSGNMPVLQERGDPVHWDKIF